MPKLSEWLFGSSPQTRKTPAMNADQKALLHNLIQSLSPQGAGGMAGMQAQDLLSQLLQGGEEQYKAFSDPYIRQFNEEYLPQLAERYAGMGALSSSGFGQALGAGAGKLQSDLANLRAQLQIGAINPALSQYQSGASLGLGSQPYAIQSRPGSAGLLGSALAGGLGTMQPGAFSGILGSLKGLFG